MVLLWARRELLACVGEGRGVAWQGVTEWRYGRGAEGKAAARKHRRPDKLEIALTRRPPPAQRQIPAGAPHLLLCPPGAFTPQLKRCSCGEL